MRAIERMPSMSLCDIDSECGCCCVVFSASVPAKTFAEERADGFPPMKFVHISLFNFSKMYLSIFPKLDQY